MEGFCEDKECSDVVVSRWSCTSMELVTFLHHSLMTGSTRFVNVFTSCYNPLVVLAIPLRTGLILHDRLLYLTVVTV